MTDTHAKKRRQAKWAFIAGNAGLAIWYMDTLSSYPSAVDDAPTIAGSIVLIVVCLAFIVFLSSLSPAGRTILKIWPDSRIYVTSLSLLAIGGAVFRILTDAGVSPVWLLALFVVVLSCVYIVSLLPSFSNALSTFHYSKQGIHIIFLVPISLTLLAMTFRV